MAADSWPELATALGTGGAGIALKLTVIDYIVVHELCHLHQRDHTDAFWNEVDKVLPDHRERKEWLRTRGAMLDL